MIIPSLYSRDHRDTYVPNSYSLVLGVGIVCKAVQVS